MTLKPAPVISCPKCGMRLARVDSREDPPGAPAPTHTNQIDRLVCPTGCGPYEYHHDTATLLPSGR